MSSPTQLSIVLVNGGGTVVIPIAESLIGFDSGQSASTQTGFAAADSMVRNVMRYGFWNASQTAFYPASQIQSISIA